MIDIMNEDSQTSRQSIVADYYNQSVRFYERWSGKLHGGYHFGIPNQFRDLLSKTQMVVNMSNRVIDMLDVQPTTQHVLDAGCGVGDVARLLRMRYPKASLKIHGVTISPEQVMKARRQNEQGGLGVDIQQGDFEELSFQDQYFDRIFFVDSLCYGEGEDKKKALHEAARVLKPGGRIVIADVFFKRSPRTCGRFLQWCNTKLNNTWKVHEWAVEGEFLKKAQELGLTLFTSQSLRWKIAPSVLHVPCISLPVTAFHSIKDPTLRDEVRALFSIGFFGTLVGMHPAFQYKILVLQKSL